MTKLTRWATITFLFLCALYTLWAAIFIYESSFIAIDGKRYFCLFDDAMISMRYAWNLSHGNGLVWNPGEYVEGYSNFLMVMLMAVATYFFDKIHAVLAIQVLGIFFVLGIAFYTRQIFLNLCMGLRKPIAECLSCVAVLGVFLYYPISYWSLMGMESGLLTLLLMAGFHDVLCFEHSRKDIHLYRSAILFGLAFLTRNDSIIFSMPALMYLYQRYISIHSNDGAPILKPLISSVVLLFIIIASFLCFRYFYYGELVPNTYVLRFDGTDIFSRLKNGFSFSIPFFKEVGISAVIICLGLLRSGSPAQWLVAVLPAIALLYQIFIGGDAFPYWRFITPTIPFVLLSLLNGSISLSDFIGDRSKGLPSPFRKFMDFIRPVGVILMFGGALYSLSYNFSKDILPIKIFLKEESSTNVNTALALTELTKESATVGVFWAGAIPYFSGRPAIDFLGKNDTRIARVRPDMNGGVAWFRIESVPEHNKYDLNYSIRESLPAYVQGFQWGSQDLVAVQRTFYRNVQYRGLELSFLKDSKDVLWDNIKN